MPAQTGSGLITGPVGITGSPHELFTAGGTGITCASLIQATVDPSLGGSTIIGAVTV